MKTCNTCGETKEIEEFSFRGNGKRRNTCRACVSKRDKKYQDRKKEQDNAAAEALVTMSRYEPARLLSISESEFKERFTTPFTEYDNVRKNAISMLEKQGLLSNSSNEFDDGTYLVVGESRGKHTKTKMFEFLKNLFDFVEADQIIHLGAAVDDDGDLSNKWSLFNGKATFVAKHDELPLLHQSKNDFGVEIVIDQVRLGDVFCKNQTEISAYTSQSISSLNTYLYSDPSIVNSTRLEYFQKNSPSHSVFISSTGTTAEPHVSKEVKGSSSKTFSYFASSKFDKMRTATSFWQQGVTIVEVFEGVPYVYPLSIKHYEGGYVTVFAGYAITDKGVFPVDSSQIIIADTHVPNMCKPAFNLMLDMVQEIDADSVVVLGDVSDCRSLNHHVMERKEEVDGNLLDEVKGMSSVLMNIRSITDADILVQKGNHDRWYERFARRFTGLKGFFDNLYESICKEYRCSLLESDFSEGDVNYLHGDDPIIGQNGVGILDKISRTFPFSLNIVGHSHRPALFRNCVNVPCLAEYDQGYNSPISNWKHGFTILYKFGGMVFPINILFEGDGSFSEVRYGGTYYATEEQNVDNPKNIKLIL